jgi:uncharacterized membrane protein YqjE
MPDANPGLLGSIRQFAATLTSIVSTRLELLANELQQERQRLTQMLVFAWFALVFFSIGILLLTAFIIVLFWDDHRLATLGGLCAACFALGTLMAWLLRSKAREKSGLFSDSLAELAKDRKHLGPGDE